MNNNLWTTGVKLFLAYFNYQKKHNQPQVTTMTLSEKDVALLELRRKEGAVIVVLGTRGTGKCVSVDTPLCLKSGKIITAGNCGVGENIPCLRSDLTIGFTTVLATANLGFQKCLKLKLASGRQIVTTIEHPFYTITGWRQASELGIGDRIASARAITVFGNTQMPDYQIKVLAYLIGDGGIAHGVGFTNKDEDIARDFIEAAIQFPNIKVTKRVYSEGDCPSYAPVGIIKYPKRIPNTVGLSYKNRDDLEYLYNKCQYTAREIGRGFGVINQTIDKWIKIHGIIPHKKGGHGSSIENTIVTFLKEQGLYGHKSATKFIPECIFTLPRKQMALFIRTLYSTDGYVSKSTIEYTSKSEKLCFQLQHLLLRFGVLSRVRTSMSKLYGKECGLCSNVIISEPTSRLNFVNEIGPILGKEDQLTKLRSKINITNINPGLDTVPVEVWSYLKENEVSLGSTNLFSVGHRWEEMGRKQISLAYSPSRQTVLTVANITKNHQLRELGNSDIFWDRIEHISETEAEVCDLMTLEHNFLANDTVVHNTELAYRLAEFIGKPTYAVSPEQKPHPEFIHQIQFSNVDEMVPPNSTVIFDDLPVYVSSKDYHEELVINLERIIPMVRHERKWHLIFSSQSAAQADKYILDCDAAFLKPLGLLTGDMERPNIRKIYKEFATPEFEGHDSDWVKRHAYFLSPTFRGIIEIGMVD